MLRAGTPNSAASQSGPRSFTHAEVGDAGKAVGHENLRADVGLRQATPHSEVLFTSSRHARYQRPDRVQLAPSDWIDAFRSSWVALPDGAASCEPQHCWQYAFAMSISTAPGRPDTALASRGYIDPPPTPAGVPYCNSEPDE